jgi:hypothetical protein
MTRQLKAGIVQQVEAVTARQWHSKNISAATDTDTTTEEDAVISMRFPPRLHDKDQEEEKQQSVSHKLQANSASLWLAQGIFIVCSCYLATTSDNTIADNGF